MHLKSLGLEGFKSFADSTELQFDNGFTAIVGPNGCGKSNVSDAIRWVIGEQSSKSLRGTKAVDLIFNGSGSRKPLNRAEISLTLADVPHGIRIANVPNISDEVKLTRCYHRSGESEFYINQIPCRLKDITDFLLDVGISPKVLTVIEQGHIHEIITAKSENRRILIEEAAGILKFKHRRNEASRKLDSSEQNLARISDIVQELGRQAESLKRQANKAEKYKAYQTEIKDVSIQLFSRKLLSLSKGLKQIETELETMSARKEDLTAQSTLIETQSAELKLSIDETYQQLNEVRDQVHSLSLSIGRDEQTAQHQKSQIQQIENDNQKADGAIRVMTNEAEEANVTVEQRRQELGGLSDRINKERDLQEEQKAALEEKKQALAPLQEQVSQAEKRVYECLRLISDKKGESASLETRRQFLQKRAEEWREEMESAGAQQNELEEKRRAQETELGELNLRLEALQEEKQALGEQVREGRKTLETLEAEGARIKENYITKASFLNSLRDLRKKFEGFQSGVKCLMGANGSTPPMDGLREVLVDVLRAPAEFVTANETVLGDKLQSIIVDDYANTLQAVGYLNNEKSGRGSFVPIRPKDFPTPPVYLNGNPGVLGLASDKIECKEEYRSVIEQLLKNVVVVKDLETAIQLFQNPQFHGSIVTQNGELIDAQGVVTGGQNADNSEGLLQPKRELEELTQQVEQLERESEEAQKDISDHKGRLLAWETKLKQVEQSAHDQSIAVSNARKDLELALREIERHKKRAESLNAELEKSAAERTALDTQIQELLALIQRHESEKNELDQSLEDSKSRLHRQRNETEVLISALGDLQALIASLIGKRENTLTEIKRIEQQSDSLRHRIAQRHKDLENNAEAIRVKKESVQELERSLLESVREKDALAEQLTRQEETLRDQEEEDKQLDEKARGLIRTLQELSESISQTEIKKSELKINAAHLTEKAYDDFNVVLTEESAAQVAPMDDEEAKEADERVRELKGKIGRMGEVNLAALSDFQQANERYIFLKTQQEDLDQSIQMLKETIERINQNTRERFLETFERVNENFKAIFARLFMGGKAELSLTDPDNPLESGVEITANPVGKAMQSLQLLSGGEKAMTAVALMFSVFKVRPSPFCLLDEIDAPLDEANVIRFQEMLKEMAENTQFIIITHNQKTMSFANSLYGVTMEERGVSKTVSVHLN